MMRLSIINQNILTFRFKCWAVSLGSIKISPACSLLPLLFLLILSGCDNGSSSDGGSGQAEPQSKLVGPNLNGNDWSGYIKNTKGRFDQITAVIQHSGDRVTIQTSIQSGIGSVFTGTIDSRGRMNMIDAFDNEVWTTIDGPASNTSVKLTDYVFNEKNQRSDINSIVLRR